MRTYNLEDLKISLGGGGKTTPGFLNLDLLLLPEVDIVCNLNQGIPLKSNSVSELHAFHLLEHLQDLTPIVEEIYRVCQHQALVKIKTPYFKSTGAFKDPTHKTFLTEETFYYFSQTERTKRNLPNYNTQANFQIQNISYIWYSPWIGRLPFKKKLTKHFWDIAKTIYYELRVIKAP